MALLKGHPAAEVSVTRLGDVVEVRASVSVAAWSQFCAGMVCGRQELWPSSGPNSMRDALPECAVVSTTVPGENDETDTPSVAPVNNEPLEYLEDAEALGAAPGKQYNVVATAEVMVLQWGIRSCWTQVGLRRSRKFQETSQCSS